VREGARAATRRARRWLAVPGRGARGRATKLLGAVIVTAIVSATVVATIRPEDRVSAQDLTLSSSTRPRVLTYLRRISGVATVAGQHNREPLSRPTMWTDKVRSITDATPGLYGSDFAFTGVADRPRMVSAAIAQWQAGALVTLMWHMCPPGLGQTCDWKRDVQSRLTDAQWAELVTDGTRLNQAWKSQIDVLVPFLRRLQDNGVEVLWRPVHELNDDWAWWGGRPGPEGSSKLFRIMHDYLVGKGLTNLVWVWSVKDLGVESFADYYPGDRYVDVVGLDAWMSRFPSAHVYDRLRAVAGSKPMALAEVGTIPTPSQLAQQPLWTYFMVWAEMLTQRSSVPRIQFTYGDKRILARDRIALPLAGTQG
jgi:mannan endo-1,4-beta-mannosidase